MTRQRKRLIGKVSTYTLSPVTRYITIAVLTCVCLALASSARALLQIRTGPTSIPPWSGDATMQSQGCAQNRHDPRLFRGGTSSSVTGGRRKIPQLHEVRQC